MSENPIVAVRSFLSNESVRRRFEEMLGKNAASFVNSIINTCSGSNALKQCTPASICSAGLKAASVNLPIEPALGFAAIVPYKNVAQFQIMWKGYIQLCIRTNQYERINITEIYSDELETYNPITGDVIFKDPKEFKLRYEADGSGVVNTKNVVGAYAYFRLRSGFECSMHMSKDQLIAHGKRFSKAYQYDIAQKKKASLWSTDPVSMFKKTVAKLLLGRFGIMSIEMQQAFRNEGDDFQDAAQLASDTTEDQAGSEVIDTNFEDKQESASKSILYDCPKCGEPASIDEVDREKGIATCGNGNCRHRFKPDASAQKKEKPKKRGRKPKKEETPEPETETDESKPDLPSPKKSNFKYVCKKCGLEFDKPKVAGRGEASHFICPELACCSPDIEEN